MEGWAGAVAGFVSSLKLNCFDGTSLVVAALVNLDFERGCKDEGCISTDKVSPSTISAFISLQAV